MRKKNENFSSFFTPFLSIENLKVVGIVFSEGRVRLTLIRKENSRYANLETGSHFDTRKSLGGKLCCA